MGTRAPRLEKTARKPLVGKAAGKQSVVQFIRNGVPVELVEQLAQTLEIPRGRVFAMLGISERTVARRLIEGALKPIESDRFYRLDRILALAEDAIGDSDKARGWLKHPNIALGGETPFDFLDTEAGMQEVENLLQQIKHGVYV
jgi:putative toxin-antitoxin system antitoxin component (TIGR02293 family)